MSRPEAVLRSLFWIAVAVVVTYPASFSPTDLLLGHPDVDVWNHAWGYWFVPHQIADFEWPFATDMIGIPEGGDLYFIDMLGALVGTPIAWLIGPAAAYNGVMILRVAAAGMAACTWVANITSPVKAHSGSNDHRSNDASCLIK